MRPANVRRGAGRVLSRAREETMSIARVLAPLVVLAFVGCATAQAAPVAETFTSVQRSFLVAHDSALPPFELNDPPPRSALLPNLCTEA